VKILRIYISPGHNFFGHHGRPPGVHSVVEISRAHCLRARGIEGDRFCDYKDDYRGQITFFADEVYADLREKCGVPDVSPAAFRRNVITRDVDLNALIGQEFEVQGVRFSGTEECRPCAWMNQAFHPRAEALLRGRGGLRARILNDGWIDAAEDLLSTKSGNLEGK